MARIRRRAFPLDADRPESFGYEEMARDTKYGRRGNARGKSSSGSRGQSSKSQQLPNKPRKG